MKWIETHRKETDSRIEVFFNLYLKFDGSGWNNSTSRKVCTLKYVDIKQKEMWGSSQIQSHRRFKITYSDFIQHIHSIESVTNQFVFDQLKYDAVTIDYAKKIAVDGLKNLIQSIYVQLN